MGDLLFVYGTLRKDAKNEMHHMLARYSTYVGKGHIQGQLFDVGTYPGVFLKEGCLDMVVGEVYSLNSIYASRTWQILDQYEGCGPSNPDPHEYRRQKVNVFLDDGNEVDSWAYTLTSLPLAAVRIPGGDYLDWHRQKQDQ
jgi:gamma-glutamylcyclotransferase (GGCT)/AIG2-like uncharacterized protein YtfP